MGNLLGEEKARRAGVAANASILMSLAISLVWRSVALSGVQPVDLLELTAKYSTMFMVFRDSWAHLFNDDPGKWSAVVSPVRKTIPDCCVCVTIEVVELVAAILPIVALFQVFDGLGGVTAGILRAIGKQVSATSPCARICSLTLRPSSPVRCST